MSHFVTKPFKYKFIPQPQLFFFITDTFPAILNISEIKLIIKKFFLTELNLLRPVDD